MNTTSLVSVTGKIECSKTIIITKLYFRTSCPLTNYLPVRHSDGGGRICFLYMKTVERAAFPSRLWEKVKLSRNFDKAMSQIN